MDILLDTNIISESTRPLPDERAARWFKNQPPNKLFLSSVTIGEIQRGIVHLPHSKRRGALEKWMERDLIRRFEGRILPFDQEAAIIWGQMMSQGDHAGKPRPVLDTQIASIAHRYGMAVATRDKIGFSGLGLKIINPWH